MAERKDSPEQAEFREDCRAWLGENRPDPPSFRLPQGAIEVMTEEQRVYLADWQYKCWEAGLVGTDYPKPYGGGGREKCQAVANQEMSRARVPMTTTSSASQSVVGPKTITSSQGPTMQLLSLLNTSGFSGISIFDSSACAR